MFKLPAVKILSRCVNKITITFLLILVQLVWMASLYLRLTEYAAWLNGVMTALSVLIILFLVRKDENPAYTIAWMALIGITPVFGGLMYLFWGNKRPSRRMRRRMAAVDRRHRDLTRQPPGQLEDVDPRARALSGYIARYGPWPAWKDTAVEYFSSGEAMFPRLLEDLRRAKKFIFLETFIIRPGRMWNAVEDILREKAAAGVDVRVIYDDMGCIMILPTGYDRTLEQMGIKCRIFNPFVPILSSRFNTRDHRKICVIDGNVGFTGGINLADEYINEKEKHGHWKDTAVMLKGEAARSFTLMFLQMWNVTEQPPKFGEFCAAPVPPVSAPGFVMPFGDCPPSLDLLTINGLCGCDTVLIPIQCEYYALEGLSELMNTLKTVRKKYNRYLDIEGVVFTMYAGRLNLTMQVVAQVKKYYGNKVYKSVIPRTVRLSEAPSFGMPINYYDPVSKGCEAYSEMAAEFLANNR